MQFKRAERKRAKLRLAICGPSGSGKTYSALLIAKGIGGKVAVVDTERGSAELYADSPGIGMDYDVLQLAPPYSPQRYVEAIKAAVAGGYNVVIIDSGSHAWMGDGGMLEMVDAANKASGHKAMAGWKAVAPHEKKFLDALTGQPIHLIMTLRTKTEWDMSKGDDGKVRPTKIGLKPEQRQGIEYEFTTVFDMSVDGHIASVSKDRTNLFDGQHFVPSEATGEALLAWLNSGAAPASTPPPTKKSPPPNPKGDNEKRERIDALIREVAGGNAARITAALTNIFNELQRDMPETKQLDSLKGKDLDAALELALKWHQSWRAKKEQAQA